MKKLIKWLFILGICFVVLVVGGLVIVPKFVDVEKYRPEIEKKVTGYTGRPFTLGGKLNLSFFPWVGVALSDVHLGNPRGFKEKDFISVKSFEIRVRVLPLLSKTVEVKRFVLIEPRIVLEKRKDGKGNWEGIGQAAAEKKPEKEKVVKKKKASQGLPIKSLMVGECTIKNGSLLWLDDAKKERKEVSDLNLSLKNVSFDKPVEIDFSALLNGKPVSLDGKLGPIGNNIWKANFPLDFKLKALNELNAVFKGNVKNEGGVPRYNVSFNVSPFSLKRVLKQLTGEDVVKTSDPKALEKIALQFKANGDTKNVSVSDGVMVLDDSKLNFSAQAKNFDRPKLVFDLTLDKINVDRYLSPAGGKKGYAASEGKASKMSRKKKGKSDYSALRKLQLNGIIKAGEVIVSGAKLRNIAVKIKGANGVFRLDPAVLKLYQGDVSSKIILDVRQRNPRSSIQVNARGVQVGPLLNDVAKKDILEGTTKLNVSLRMIGDDPALIKKTLNGKGDLLFTDGAIVGLDIAGMMRNVKATFGLGEKAGTRPKTDFSELYVPFTMTNGVFNTTNTTMKSPLLRLAAKGSANLVKETLDFKIEPKFVASLKGQGDRAKHSGFLVPVLVSGTFSSPKFRPDLKAMFKQKLEQGLKEPSRLKGLIGGGEKKGEKSGLLEEKAGDLLRKLPFGK